MLQICNNTATVSSDHKNALIQIERYYIIGASLSEPHMNGTAVRE